MNPEPGTLASLRDVKVLDLPPLLAPEYVRAQRVLPIALEDSTLTVVAPYDRDEDVEDDLRVAFGVPRVRWLRAPEGEVDAAIERALANEAGTVEDLVRDLSVVEDATGFAGAASVEDLTSLANQPPVVKLVNLILLEALEARASDPAERRMRLEIRLQSGSPEAQSLAYQGHLLPNSRRPAASAEVPVPLILEEAYLVAGLEPSWDRT